MCIVNNNCDVGAYIFHSPVYCFDFFKSFFCNASLDTQVDHTFKCAKNVIYIECAGELCFYGKHQPFASVVELGSGKIIYIYADAVASDGHGVNDRVPRLDEAEAALIKYFDANVADRLLRRSPGRLLGI